MATQQSDPTAGVPIPTGGSSSSTVQQPIGVPFYITDPSSGQPMMGPNGQPLRWGATVPVAPNGPGSMGTQGPGTAPSSGSQYVLPRYFDGAQWLPASLPPDQIAALQKKMVQAGLLKPGSAQLGIWDANSMQAYMQLLAYANSSGLDAAAALDRWGQQHTADSGAAGLPAQVTSADDLRPVFRKAIIDTLGQGWSQDQIDQMVSAYQNVQAGASRAAQSATSGTVTAAPSPTDFAVAQATKQDPTGAQEHDALGFINQFKQMLGGWQ